jgi:hypothetical protein
MDGHGRSSRRRWITREARWVHDSHLFLMFPSSLATSNRWSSKWQKLPAGGYSSIPRDASGEWFICLATLESECDTCLNSVICGTYLLIRSILAYRCH